MKRQSDMMRMTDSDSRHRIPPRLEILGFFFILLCGLGVILWMVWFFFPGWQVTIFQKTPLELMGTRPLSPAGIVVLIYIVLAAYTCYILFERRRRWAYYLMLLITVALAYHLPVRFTVFIKNNRGFDVPEIVVQSLVAVFFLFPLIQRRSLFR
ncbi:MAG: hypothetical protein V1809_06855 [Planctomycetota bacterium]